MSDVQPADLVVSGRYVLTLDPQDAILENASVVIRDGRIVAIAPTDLVQERFTPARTIEHPDMAVMPGLIDCHVHTCQQLPRGLGEGMPVVQWLQRIVSFEAAMDEDEVSASARAACLEMIKGGTTGFIEACGNPLYADAVGEAIVASGLRGVLTRSTMEYPESDWETPPTFVMDADENLRASEALIDRWHNAANGRVSAWAGWRQQWNLSDETIVKLVQLARDRGVGFHGHLSTRRYGQVEHLDRLGVLGPEFVFAHAIRYTERELGLIKHYDVKINHNPGASMYGAYGAGIAGSFPEMIQRGVCVCIGCDSVASGMSLDMFQATRLASVLHKEVRQDASLIPPSTALRLAVTNGARACRWPDVGSLVAGNRADLIVVDVAQPHLQPLHDLVSNLVYCASGQDVVTTIVDGQVLMDNRVVEVMNERAVLAQAAEAATSVVKKWRA